MKKVVVKASLAIMAAATVLGQGALIPVGAPSPSMKTLDQIEPRTVITSLPCFITQPGGYVLGGNLTTDTGSGGDGVVLNWAITAATFGSDGTQAVISWRSSPARLYRLEATSTLAPPDWQDCGLGLLLPGSGTETTGIINSTNAPARFYRVRAMLPLAP